MTENDQIGPATPFFIVTDIEKSLEHYVGKLGFECRFKAEEDDPFFALVGRGTAQIMIKAVDVPPLPNHQRHEWAGWDAFLFVSDPDALAKEFEGRGVPFRRALGTTDDNLRGFEIADPDGYVCFFGKPLAE